MKFRKALIKVFSVNFLQLITNLIVGFCVPYILSLQGYAYLKTFTLYMSYAGLLHFGLIDGIFIKYGGKKIEKINKGDLRAEHDFLIILSIIVMIIFIVFGLIFNNLPLLIFGITIIPYMLGMFFQMFFQAIGEFSKYQRIMFIYIFVYMITNFFLSIILKCKNYIPYCLTIFISYILEVIYCEFEFRKKYKKNNNKFDFNNIFNLMKVGFVILLGNLIVVGLFGIDKWFIKIFFDVNDFAYYSFAVSLLNIINVLVKAVSITFYSYLCKKSFKEPLSDIRDYLLVFGGFASGTYFGFSLIVNLFIKKYIPSLNIISITFSALPYMILINVLYINLYKTNKDEKKYLKVVAIILFISIFYNFLAMSILKSPLTIAIATILTMVTWAIYSTFDLKLSKHPFNMLAYCFLLTILFLLFSNCFNWLIGGILYLIFYLVLTVVFEKKVIIKIRNYLRMNKLKIR